MRGSKPHSLGILSRPIWDNCGFSFILNAVAFKASLEEKFHFLSSCISVTCLYWSFFHEYFPVANTTSKLSPVANWETW